MSSKLEIGNADCVVIWHTCSPTVSGQHAPGLAVTC